MKTNKSRVSIVSMPSTKSLRDMLMSDAMSYYTEATENNRYVTQLKEVTKELASKSAIFTGLKKEYLCRNGTLEMLKRQKIEKNNFSDEELENKETYMQQLKEINDKMAHQIDEAQEELKSLFQQISNLKYSSIQIREDSEYTNVLIQINDMQASNNAKKQKIEILEQTKQEKQNTITILQNERCDLLKTQDALLQEQKQIEESISKTLSELNLPVIDTTIDKDHVNFINEAVEHKSNLINHLTVITEREYDRQEAEKREKIIASQNAHKHDTNQEVSVAIDLQNTKRRGFLQNMQPQRAPSSPPHMKTGKSTAAVFVQRIKERFDRRHRAVNRMNKETHLLEVKYEKQAGPIQRVYEDKLNQVKELEIELERSKTAREELSSTIKILTALKDEEKEGLMQVNTAIRSTSGAMAEKSRIKGMKDEIIAIKEEAEKLKKENDDREAKIQKRSEEIQEMEVEHRRDELMAKREEDILKQLNSDIQEFLNQNSDENVEEEDMLNSDNNDNDN